MASQPAPRPQPRPVPPRAALDTSDRVILRLAPGEDAEAMVYAAGLLLDAARLPLPLEVAGAAATMLMLPGDQRIDAAELRAVFDSVSLAREMRARRDRHGRFDESRLGDGIGDPWITRLALELRASLESVGAVRELPRRRWSLVLTHDVDHVSPLEPVSLGKAARREVAWFPLTRAFNSRLFVAAVERLLEIEARHGARSWFFLLAGPYGIGRHDSRYDLRWRSARRVIEAIRAGNGRIGLHGSYRASERDAYAEEARRLHRRTGAAIVAHRNHYLRFDAERTFSQLERAGIAYDMSVGFATRPGFRVPLAGAYRPFAWDQGRAAEVVEVPLVYMDRPEHVDDAEGTLARLATIFAAVRDNGGCVSLLVHPEVMAVDERWGPFYERVLALAASLDADLSGALPVVPRYPRPMET